MPRYPRPVRRALAATGRVLVTAGLLLLAFVAYQLWGTGLYEAREQARLEDDFRAALAAAGEAAGAATTTTAPGPGGPAPTTSTAPAPPPPPPPPPSGAVAMLRIPAIGLDRVVVEGVSVADLRRGPGHYPDTPLPGEVGNAAIAGHRTTYGAPFGRLDELDPGDAVVVTTLAGTYRYVVTGTEVVEPGRLSVLDPTPEATLTLTTCHPRFSAAERLVVRARLDPAADNPPPRPPSVDPPATPDGGGAAGDTAGLSGGGEDRWPTVAWGALAAAVGLLWWWWFHRYPRWTTWLAGALPFAVVLFVFYAHLERLMPSSY